nr:hypothetical protein [Tanacetum cinerariifolium]
MMYGVIVNPGIVDNPDVPSYQPHVHGRCDPPALIPLQMNGIGLEIGCCLDTGFVNMTGSWRVHCVMGSAGCDVRLAVPMGPQNQNSFILKTLINQSKRTMTSSDDFTRGVEDGLRLSKRIYFGKDRSVAPPKMTSHMTRSSSVYPTSPMMGDTPIDCVDVDDFLPYQ